MMSSHDEPEEADSDDGIYHPVISEDLLLSGLGDDNLADKTESGQNENINLRVPEEPE